MSPTSGINTSSGKGPGETINPKTPHSGDAAPDHLPFDAKKTTRRALTGAFNMAVGAGVGMAVKSIAVGAACTAGIPVLAAGVGAAALAGGVTATIKMAADNHFNFRRVWAKENRSANLKKLAFHSGFSMLGALGFGLASECGLFSKVFNFFSGAAEQTVVPAAEQTVAIPASAVERAAGTIGSDPDATAKARLVLDHAQQGNAQAIKDLGFFMFNGREGVDLNRPLAVDLFRSANALGHGGAGVDLAYVEYHGLGNVPQNQGSGIAKMLDSLDTMRDQGQAGTPENKRGWNLLRSWAGPLPSAETAVSADLSAQNAPTAPPPPAPAPPRKIVLAALGPG